jgi:hypothetical protein
MEAAIAHTRPIALKKTKRLCAAHGSASRNMFQAICAPRGWTGGACGSPEQTRRRRDLFMRRALPPPARFDRHTHLKIMTECHIHLSTTGTQAPFRCVGAGGDLFFAMRLYAQLFMACPRYPQLVRWP